MDYNVTYRQKDKSIQCIISYKDSDGTWRQKSKQGFKAQKDAKPWIKSSVDELEKLIKVEDKYRGITFGEFKEIFKNDKKREHTYNTKMATDTALSHFKNLDNIPLIDIGYINIKPCVDALIDKGFKNSTISTYLTKLKVVFNHAIDQYEIISANPIKDKQYPLPQLKGSDKIRVLSASEIKDLFDKLKGKDYYISLIALKCGLRIGEIIGLIDSEIDFKNAEINIKRQWKLLDGGVHGFGPPKSNNSYRTVPIPLGHVSILQEYVNNCILGIDRRVFIEESTTGASNRLNKKYKRYGYDISVHDLRHTYATTLIANGFDFKTVAKLMGDTVETIISTYSHFTAEMYSSAKNRINKIL